MVPATVEMQVRSVTMVVCAGTILDRGASEAELRTGIAQALEWATWPGGEPGTGDGPSSKPSIGIHSPRVRVQFINPDNDEHSHGISELPFETVPAALASAVSQASGLYLDRLPIHDRALMRLLRED